MDNLTAKMSCYARAFHNEHSKERVFSDTAAKKILLDDYDKVEKSLCEGMSFFLKDFNGTTLEDLTKIVNGQLAPSVLARSAYCERMLENEVRLGCKQYVVLAAGYDTFCVRNANEKLSVYEIDLPEMVDDKTRRIQEAELDSTAKFVACDLSKEDFTRVLLENGFEKSGKSFVSLLGISYYLTKEEFSRLLNQCRELISSGSAICFDYPCEIEEKEAITNRALAAAAGEEMKAKYSYEELELLLQENDFLIYEHLDDEKMTDEYFLKYNLINRKNTMRAPKGVGYVLAVKKNVL